MSISYDSDVVIVGAGMVGLTAALACASLGLSVIVLERAETRDFTQARFDGRVSAIALGSQRQFARLGVWPYLEAHACPIEQIRISDTDSPHHLHYDHQEVGTEPLGYIAENRHIQAALQQAMAAHVITLHSHVAVIGYQAAAGHVTLTTSTQAVFTAKLVLAVDGKYSPLRHMAAIDVVEKPYDQTAIVCTIAHEKPHGNIAQERFLPAGPFAILPLPDDEQGRHRSSLVWTESRKHAAGLIALPEAAFLQEVVWRFTDYLGALTLASERFSYPLTKSYASRMTAPRLALVGDAAHSIHPIAGQGANLGFRDVEVLHRQLHQALLQGRDIGASDTLDAYAHLRKFDVHSMLMATHGLNALFATQQPLLQVARRFGLSGVGHLPPLKRLFMRHAMGTLVR